ncbi:hypothetical protein DFH06DRAFT_1337188 [Mycena polygramma]|nr:hypothetical protein DFH06DRAFT_1337188 [Mycena polygramma]
MPPPGHPHCIAPYRPEPGDEDVAVVFARGDKIYVVTFGKICGFFSSEARARKQVEGFSNGRWRAAKNWPRAISLWNESCDVYHSDGCPPHSEQPSMSPTRLRNAAPTSRQDVERHNAQVVFRTPEGNRYRSTKVTESESYSLRSAPPPAPSPPVRVSPSKSTSALSPSQSRSSVRVSPLRIPHASTSTAPHYAPVRLSPSKSSLSKSSASPRRLSTMDPVEAFSRMGVADPRADTRPVKQWAISGVNKFFAERLEAVEHIFDLDLQQAHLLGSRNVNKLRAFQRGEQYVPGNDEKDDDD